MEYDKDKVDEMTLALLSLVIHGKQDGERVWKGFDWETMNRLHEKGYITDPRSKAKSVALLGDAARRSEELFEKYFGKKCEVKRGFYRFRLAAGLLFWQVFIEVESAVEYAQNIYCSVILC